MQSTLICFFYSHHPANHCQVPHNTDVDLPILFPVFSIDILVVLILAKAASRSMQCNLAHSSLVVRLKPRCRGDCAFHINAGTVTQSGLN